MTQVEREFGRLGKRYFLRRRKTVMGEGRQEFGISQDRSVQHSQVLCGTSRIGLMSPVRPHPSVSFRHLSTASPPKVNTFITESAKRLMLSSTPPTLSWGGRQRWGGGGGGGGERKRERERERERKHAQWV